MGDRLFELPNMHLMVNHVSLFAMMVGTLALGYLNTTAVKRSTFFLQLGCMVAAGLFAFLAFQSGEGAEDALKAVGGCVDAFIEPHAQAAVWGLSAGILACVLAIFMELPT